jgi:prevent-host-death family protein
MKMASITEAKNQLSALIDRVRHGESILIVDRGTPVARLEPVHGAEANDARIARLVRAGLLIPATAPPYIPKPVTIARTGVSIVQAVLDERNEGR